MTIDGKHLLPVLDSVSDLVSVAMHQHQSDAGTIADLQRKLAQARADNVTLEKVASAPRPVLDPVFVDKTLGQLVSMRLLSPGEDVKLASQLQKNPNVVLDVLTKMAETLVTPSEGHSVERDADDKLLDEDPDGWFSAARKGG